MKKSLLFVCLAVSFMFAQSTGVLPTQETRNVNNCTKVNVLGIVSIWSGTMDVVAQNPITGAWDVVVSSKSCGKGGGSWDWFWE